MQSGTEFGFRIVLVVLLVFVNGFFASAEVALLSVRNSRLRQMAEEGQAGAQTALSLLANPERLLSVTQVGVTLASLGLGWAGEDTVFRIFMAAFHPLITPAMSRVIQGAALAVSFLLISYFHVVVGEVLPKNLAIEKADRLAIVAAPALLVFYRLSAPFVIVIERTARLLSRAMGLHGERAGGHSAEELRLIVSAGQLPPLQEEMMHRVLDLDRLSVREIMVPRNDIVSIPADAGLDDILRTMIEQQHSRLPVYQDRPEQIIGILYYKDLLPVWQERRAAIRAGRPSRTFVMQRLLRKALVVPETKPLSQTLVEFKQGHSHMAMVVDEFGTIVGLLTVEDVLEQIVGDIADEYDEKSEPRAAELQEIEIDGTTRIRDLETDYGIAIPTAGGFETLAGFLLYRLAKIPRAGENLEYDGRRYTVLEMDRNRIARVRIEKLPPAAAAQNGRPPASG